MLSIILDLNSHNFAALLGSFVGYALVGVAIYGIVVSIGKKKKS